MTRWSQFVAMTLAQLSGRARLRNVVSNLSAQTRKLYHLGTGTVSGRLWPASTRSNSAHSMRRCSPNYFPAARALRLDTAFKNKLHSLDASPSMCLSVYPWAKFRTTKGAVKLHVGLDHDGLLPTFMTITDGKN